MQFFFPYIISSFVATTTAPTAFASKRDPSIDW